MGGVNIYLHHFTFSYGLCRDHAALSIVELVNSDACRLHIVIAAPSDKFCRDGRVFDITHVQVLECEKDPSVRGVWLAGCTSSLHAPAEQCIRKFCCAVRCDHCERMLQSATVTMTKCSEARGVALLSTDCSRSSAAMRVTCMSPKTPALQGPVRCSCFEIRPSGIKAQIKQVRCKPWMVAQLRLTCDLRAHGHEGQRRCHPVSHGAAVSHGAMVCSCTSNSTAGLSFITTSP